MVVHGIGAQLQAFDLIGLVQLKSIIECCSWMRANHTEVSGDLGFTGRVEYIPIEWHERFNRLSRQNDPNVPGAGLDDISLDTIPHLRSFANDAMLDTLYFMSDQHHDQIIDLVVHELNAVVDKFRKYNRGRFSEKVSIVAHSLGSIITWDILANQIISVSGSASAAPSPVPSPGKRPRAVNVLQSLFGTPPSSTKNESDDDAASAPPTVPQNPDYPQLNFSVSSTFMLGSPIAVFLLIRNQQEPLQSDYSLPGCGRIFNVYHPFDPAAYRLEPLINRRNANLEACLIPTWKGSFRVKYQARMLWRR